MHANLSLANDILTVHFCSAIFVLHLCGTLYHIYEENLTSITYPSIYPWTSTHEPVPEAKLFLRFQCTSVQELQKFVSKHKFCKISLCNSHTSVSTPTLYISSMILVQSGTEDVHIMPFSYLEYCENWYSERHISFNSKNTTLPICSSLSVQFGQNLIQNMSTKTYQLNMSFVSPGTLKLII